MFRLRPLAKVWESIMSQDIIVKDYKQIFKEAKDLVIAAHNWLLVFI